MTEDSFDDDSFDDLDIPAWIGAEPARRRAATRSAAQSNAQPNAPRRASSSDLLEAQDPYDPFLASGDSGQGYVRLPRRHRGARRVAVGSLVAFAIVVAALAGTGFWLVRQLDPGGAAGATVIVDLPIGATTPDIARLLEAAGVVGNRTIFEQYLKLKGPSRYQSGKYAFSQNSSMSEAVAAVGKGPIPPGFVQVTVPEGLRLEEIRARMAAAVPWLEPAELDAALLANTIRSRYQPNDIATLEGLVFPETYRVEEGATAKTAVTQMLSQFDQVAAELKLDSRATKLGFSPYQIVIIASMIEREARVPEDRPKIARVIYNRLAAKMRLDIDATVIYAVGGKTSLTVSDLGFDSPYNTRLYKGLPPTPIAAPGKASLEAALAPSDGPWLYYVLADREGRHYFTDSASEFDRAVADAEDAGLIK